MKVVKDIINKQYPKLRVAKSASEPTDTSVVERDKKPIDYDSSRVLINQFVYIYNSNCGEKRIKRQHVDFMIKLISVQAQQIKAMDYSGVPLDHLDVYTLTNTRRFYSTCKGLEDEFSAAVSPRTVSRWIDRLEDANMIVRLPEMGRKLRLAINPNLMKVNDSYPIIKVKLLEIFDKKEAEVEKVKVHELSVLRKELGTNCHIKTSTRTLNNKITTEVDKLNTVKHDEKLGQCFLQEPPKITKLTRDEKTRNNSLRKKSAGRKPNVIKLRYYQIASFRFVKVLGLVLLLYFP